MKPKKRILIVDDDTLILRSLKQVLQEEEYLVDTAETGQEALEKSNATLYNLALIDIRLPDMEGTRLLTEIRETTPKIRKVILTGYPDMQNAIAALNGAADHFIVKPTNPEDLIKIVKEQLRKQDEEAQYGEKKVAEFVETRLRTMELDDDKKQKK